VCDPEDASFGKIETSYARKEGTEQDEQELAKEGSGSDPVLHLAA
jgi:hypothetical protein